MSKKYFESQSTIKNVLNQNKKIFQIAIFSKIEGGPKQKMHYQRKHIEYTFFWPNFNTFEGHMKI